MFRKRLKRIGAILMSITMLASVAIVEAAPEVPEEPTVLLSLREHLDAFEHGVGAGAIDFTPIPHLQGAGPATFTVVDVDGVNELHVTNRTADWHAVDIMRAGLQAGDVITVEGRTFDAATVAIDGGAAPHPWWISQNVAANTTFTLNATLTADDMESSGLAQMRIRTRGLHDFVLTDVSIVRPAGGGDNGGGYEPGPIEPVEETLVWSFGQDSAWQNLDAGFTAMGPAMEGRCPSVLVSGDPRVTLIPHPENEGQLSVELTQRAENWHALDFMFPHIGVELGGAYRFVAYGRMLGTGARNVQWNQTDPGWGQLGARVTIPAGQTEWRLDHTMTRAQIIQAILADSQRGVRLQTGNTPLQNLIIDDVFVYRIGDVCTIGLPEPPSFDLEIPSLAEAFAPYFLLGNIYCTHDRMDTFNTRQAFLHHYNVITAENTHKPDHIAGPGNRRTVPTPEEFNFTGADRIVNWAVDNDIALVGHALVWHGQSPDWLFRNEAGQPLQRDIARERMAYYMRTLSEHFAAQGTLGAFYSWDVVNEAIASGGGGAINFDNPRAWQANMRTASPWFQAFSNGADTAAGEHGSDFIFYAFYYARKYFPYSILYYNDYNEEIPNKRDAIVSMVNYINNKWANHPSYDGRLLIEAIGMQSHYHVTGWTTQWARVREAIVAYAGTGARVSITELDITYGAHGGPAFEYLTEEQLQTQADRFARVFGYYLELSDYIHRVSLWGMSDNRSWRANGHPLLFDGNFDPKPAFWALLDLVENHDRPAVAAPVLPAMALPAVEVDSYVLTPLAVTRASNAPVWFDVVDGTLPTGLTLHSRTGIIEGVASVEGTFTFTVEVRSYDGVGTQTYTIVVGEVDATEYELIDVIATAVVTQIPGRQNHMVVTITEIWCNGTEQFEIKYDYDYTMKDNNSDYIIDVGSRQVFVSVRGNTQVREIFIIE